MNLANEKNNLNTVATFLRRWPLLPVVVVWFVVFWPINTGQSVVGFRDSAYLYYPYFKWIDEVWASGEIPLWNPYCDFGYPVVADGSSSVFYPGKLIFFLRFLDYPIRYGWYLSLHVLLAVFGGYTFARRLGADRLGATLSGFAYGFGGSVLFQVCNVIYLVSAAWLPFGLAAIWSMSKCSKAKHPIAAAVVAALMILGGDPQMAYVLGVIAGATSACALMHRRRRFRLAKRKLLVRSMLQHAKRLAIFVVLTGLLASVQILPTYFWAQQSSRLPDQFDLVSLSLEATRGSALNAVYQFSQPPWSFAELVWPNVSGKPYPIHRRWVDVLPGAERFWTPSLYVGLLTLLCAIGGLRIWGRSRKRVWLTVMAAVFAIGSFGWFGLVWLLRELEFQFGFTLPRETNELGPHVGGLYWLATIWLPKFVMFRYPAKLFVVAALSICVLAGLQFDIRRWQRIKYPALAMALISLIGWFLVEHNWPVQPRRFLSNLDWEQLFGPLDWPGAKSLVQFAMLQAAIVAAAISILAAARKLPWRRELVLSILMLDVLLANYWMLSQVDAKVFQSESAAVTKLKQTQWNDGVMPTIGGGWNLPPHFGTERATNRLSEIVAWQRATLYPKHHLDLPISIRGSFTSIEPSRPSFDSANWGWSGDPLSAIRPNRFLFLAPGSKLGNRGRSHVQQGDVEDVEIEGNKLRLKVSNIAASKLAWRVTTPAAWQVELENMTDPDSTLTAPDFELSDHYIAFELPAGEYEVTYNYDPKEFWVGCWISGLAWFAFLAHCIRRLASDFKAPRLDGPAAS